MKVLSYRDSHTHTATAGSSSTVTTSELPDAESTLTLRAVPSKKHSPKPLASKQHSINLMNQNEAASNSIATSI